MWTIDSIRVFPQNIDDSYEQSVARLSPLASGTIYHTFGYEFGVKKLSGYIVGGVDKAAIIELTRHGLTYALYHDDDWWGDYYVKSASFKMEPIAYQTLRPDLGCNATVYTVDMDLYKDE